MAPMTERNRDDDKRLHAYGDEVLAECPSCGACVRVLPHGSGRRAVCGGCAWSREETPRATTWAVPVDPFFGLPLWLRTQVAGEELWAYNAEHLAALESFVGATLRERGARGPGRTMSMAARLPRWMKTAKNRDAVLAGLARLRERLPS